MSIFFAFQRHARQGKNKQFFFSFFGYYCLAGCRYMRGRTLHFITSFPQYVLKMKDAY